MFTTTNTDEACGLIESTYITIVYEPDYRRMAVPKPYGVASA